MLSVTARHALRALTELARSTDESAMLGRELAKRAGIPKNYLSKIMWALGGAGLVDATRGIRGGYRLRRPPQDIRLIEVVELFDKPRNMQACFLSEVHPCSDADPCSAHDAWREVGQAYIRFLESTTLADIAKHEKARELEIATSRET